MIKRILLAGSVLAAIAAPARAEFAFTAGSGLTAVSVDATHSGTSRCAAANTHCFAEVPIDTSGTAFGTSGNPFNVQFPSAQTVTANAGTGNFTVVQPTGTGLHAVIDTGSTTAVTQATSSNLKAQVDPLTVATWGLFPGQNASSPTNAGLVAGQFNTTPTTIATGNSSPLQLDSAGNLLVNIKAGAGSGGTALADEAAFTQGTTSMTPMGCLFTSSVTNLTTGQAGVARCTNDRQVMVSDAALLAAAQAGTATQGAAPSGSSISFGFNGSGATGGLQQRVIGCDQSAFYDSTTSGKIVLVTGVSGRKIYVCGYKVSTGGTATNVELGNATTGTTCATSYVKLTPAWQLAANDKIGDNSPFWNGLVTDTAAKDLCANTSAGNAVQIEVRYSIQ